MSQLELKQYMFAFEEGGWNVIWAKTLRGAKKRILSKYKGDNGLTPKLSSVHLATADGIFNAMSLFY